MMSSRHADTNYSFNPWMRPEVRLGDAVDPSPVLNGEELVQEMLVTAGEPRVSSPDVPRLGYPTTEPGIVDVLAVGPDVLMRDTPTRQETGNQGSGGPALGQW